MSSIKDLFNKKHTKSFSPAKSALSASKDAESPELVAAKNLKKDEFIPPLDFSTASNFAKYGSAELYYQSAYSRIQQSYPYDGTLAEKQQFENESTYLDKYIFENVYPRTNGFVHFGFQGMGPAALVGSYRPATDKEYIYIQGGPHTASSGISTLPLNETWHDSTK